MRGLINCTRALWVTTQGIQMWTTLWTPCEISYVTLKGADGKIMIVESHFSEEKVIVFCLYHYYLSCNHIYIFISLCVMLGVLIDEVGL